MPFEKIHTSFPIIFFALAFCIIPTLFFTYSHRLFRETKWFLGMLAISLLLVMFSYVHFDPEMSQLDKRNHTLGLAPLIFCLLYKIFESLSKSIKGRPLYFSSRYTSFYPDPEASKSDGLDTVFQLLLFFLPSIICFAIGALVFP